VSVPDFPFSAKPNWQIEPVRDIGLAVRGSHIITQQSPNIEIVGTFHIIWADAGAGSSVVSLPIYLLHEEGTGRTFVLKFDSNSPPILDEQNLSAYDMSKVRVWGITGEREGEVTVTQMRFEGPRASSEVRLNAIVGTQNWATILLKYVDDTLDPNDGDGIIPHEASWYTNGIYGGSYPSLNYYFQQLSYGQISSITGTVYGWYTLSGTTDPAPPSGSGCSGTQGSRCDIVDGPLVDPDGEGPDPPEPSLDFVELVNEAISLTDSVIDFSTLNGVNLILNGAFDSPGSCRSYGAEGWPFATADGLYPLRTTWIAGCAKFAAIAHEMGHGFGLNHEGSLKLGPYNSHWDVMSSGGTCNPMDATYGCLPAGTTLAHRELLGWLPADRVLTAYLVGTAYFTLTTELFPRDTLSPPASPAGSSNVMMIKLYLPGSPSPTTYYTLEAVRKTGSTNYDQFATTTAVLIHIYDPLRADQNAAIVDLDGADVNGDGAPDGDGDPNDQWGSRWTGQTHDNRDHHLKVSVLGSSPSGGFYVKIDYGIRNYFGVRGQNNGVYYDLQVGQVLFPDPDVTLWGSNRYWSQLPGGTNEGPGLALCDDALQLVVRGLDSKIYYGSVTLDDELFSGWKQIYGSTPSKPALTAKDPTPLAADGNCELFLLVRGSDNGIYLTSISPAGAWVGTWSQLPGSTDAGPAIAYVAASDTLHMLVKGNSNNYIYWATMPVAGAFSGWSKLDGKTPSGPAIAEYYDSTVSSSVLAVVRGMDNKIYWRLWTSAGGWSSWQKMAPGATDAQPSVACVLRSLPTPQYVIAVHGLDGKIYFTRGLQVRLGPSWYWDAWRALPGSSPSSPSIASWPG